MKTSSLGYPRMGEDRKLKFAIERYWKGDTNKYLLETAAKQVRNDGWEAHRTAGITIIPSNDDTLYDHVLDTFQMFNGIGQGPDAYFDAARGPNALQMTKWFDTNYHYLRPVIGAETEWKLMRNRPLERWKEAKSAKFDTRPVILGPFTLIWLSHCTNGDKWKHLPELVQQYRMLMTELKEAGVEWVQIDEPALIMFDKMRGAEVGYVYEMLQKVGPQICLWSYYGIPKSAVLAIMAQTVPAIGVDLCSDPMADDILDWVLDWTTDVNVEAGLINGRSIWRDDLHAIRERLIGLQDNCKSVTLSASCPLWHLPHDVKKERADYPHFSFARQKLTDLALAAAHYKVPELSWRDLPKLWGAMPELEETELEREPAMVRRVAQMALNLPNLPTTTIGSFPQDEELRKTRKQAEAGTVPQSYADSMIRNRMSEWLDIQMSAGLDVLVHGEFERSDMVEHFARGFKGMVVFENAWVQSYGQRMVRPPAVVGPISRRYKITFDTWDWAQNQVKPRIVKGIMTGPTTILKWSFPQAGVSLDAQRQSIARALREEVTDLVEGGCEIVQIDEPALREAYPIIEPKQKHYEKHAVDCWRLVASAAPSEVQVHSHFCYSDFGTILQMVKDLDADVITIESARSGDMGKLAGYEGQIGPGVYDVHSPHIPTVDEMTTRIHEALKYFDFNQLWINPDCGLKTRKQDEVVETLHNMVMAAKENRP